MRHVAKLRAAWIVALITVLLPSCGLSDAIEQSVLSEEEIQSLEASRSEYRAAGESASVAWQTVTDLKAELDKLRAEYESGGLSSAAQAQLAQSIAAAKMAYEQGKEAYEMARLRADDASKHNQALEQSTGIPDWLWAAYALFTSGSTAGAFVAGGRKERKKAQAAPPAHPPQPADVATS